MGSALLTTRLSMRRLGPVLLVLAMLGWGAAAAPAATIFGTVSTQRPGAAPVPEAGASVTVLDAQTQTTVAIATTGVDGTYSTVVASGTYDVRFDPAPGGDFAPATVRDVEVEDSRKLDIVLVPAGLVRLSGGLSGPEGPVAGASLRLLSSSSSGSAVSGSDGSYSVLVPPGEYTFSGSGSGGPGLPERWSFSTEPIQLDEDRVLDPTLPPTAVLTVRVLGPDEEPVAGASVRVPPYVASGSFGEVAVPSLRVDGTAPKSEILVVTDANGEARIRVFDSSSPVRSVGETRPTGRVWPPPESGLGFLEFTPPVVEGDTTVVVHPPATVRLSGVLSGPEGPVAGASLRLSSASSFGSGVSGPDGSYSLPVPPGEYVFSGSGESGPGLPARWSFSTEPILVDGERVLNATLPSTAVLTVRVLGPDEQPVVGANVRLPTYTRSASFGDVAVPSLSSPGSFRGEFSVSTDANGEARIRVFDGSVPLSGQRGQVIPPAESGLGTLQFDPPTVEGDTTLVVHPPDAVRLSGVLSGSDGPVADASLRLSSSSGFGSGTSGPDGSYAVSVAPGAYTFGGSGSGGSGGLPDRWAFSTEPIAMDGDRALDVSFPPTSMLTVRVLAPDGEPVVGANVTLPPYARSASFGGVAVPSLRSEGSGPQTAFVLATDAEGEVQVRVFDGSAPVRLLGETRPVGRVRPPLDSGLGMLEFSAPTVEGDTTFVVQYTSSDVTAPTIACDPAPPGWHADEVSVACTAEDAGSGLADPQDAAFSLTTTVGAGREDAGAQTGTREVCDGAGNCATAGPVGPIAVDRADPAIALSQQADGGAGWWISSPAAVHATATDLTIASLDCAVDGVAQTLALSASPTSLAADVAVSGEGRHVVSCTAGDTVGHAAVADEPVGIDLTPPNPPTLAGDRAPDFASRGGWYADAVTVSAAAAGDPLLLDGSAGSGVDPASVPAPVTYATSGSHVATATVHDLAGHMSAAASATVNVDADPPTTTLTCPGDVTLGARASARWRDRDAESGLVGGPSGSLALATSAVGPHTVQHGATDNVGHVATSSCAYRVVYDYRLVGGLRSPPRSNAVAAVPPTLVTFSLGGDQGLAIFAPGFPQVRPISCVNGSPTGSAVPAAATAPLAYAAGNDRYTYRWDSGGVGAGTCVALLLGLVDGTTREVWFRG